MLLPATLSAQSLSNKQRRNIYEKVLNVVESYESLAALSSEGDDYEFRQLFTDNATVDSDIMGDISYMKTLSVDEYIKIITVIANGGTTTTTTMASTSMYANTTRVTTSMCL